MKSVKISIIVPVYNSEEYIDRCVQSLINQTLKETEIILIDDGSEDSSLKKCQDYDSQHSNIKVFCQKNAGAAKARIEGIKHAVGEYVAFVDSDDWVASSMYEHLLKLIENTKVDILQCGYQHTEGLSWKERDDIAEKRDSVRIYSSKEAMRQLYGESSNLEMNFLLWNKIYRRSLFDGLCLPEENLKINDVPFIPRILYRAERVGVCDWKGYYYFQRNAEYNQSIMDDVKSSYAKMAVEHYKAFYNVSAYFEKVDYQMYILTMKYTLIYALSVLMKAHIKDETMKIQLKKIIRIAPRQAIAKLPFAKRVVCLGMKVFW